ncbi:MAG: hypothetical protein U0802_13990 [Candidatus Binatia bacterium]
MALHAARWAWQRRSARLWQAPRVRAVALVFGGFALSGAAAAQLVGAGETRTRRVGAAAGGGGTGAGGAPAASGYHPALAMVSELANPRPA